MLLRIIYKGTNIFHLANNSQINPIFCVMVYAIWYIFCTFAHKRDNQNTKIGTSMEQVIPFKNILVSDDLDALLAGRTIAEGTVTVLMCQAGHLHLETTSNGEYDVSQHDVLLCMPDFLKGDYTHSDDFRCLVFCVPQDTLNDVVYSCLRVETNWYNKLQYIKLHPIIRLTERQIKLCKAYEKLIDLHIQNASPYQDKISDSLAQAIIFEMLEMLEVNMKSHECAEGTDMDSISLNTNKSRLNQLFYQFVRLLEDNHTSRRYVRWYANEMAITPKYLTYICNQVAGKTPTDIINAIAIREIKQSLIYTNDTVKEIAYTMNYASASSFCKYFRLQTGISPQAFRQQNRKMLK